MYLDKIRGLRKIDWVSAIQDICQNITQSIKISMHRIKENAEIKEGRTKSWTSARRLPKEEERVPNHHRLFQAAHKSKEEYDTIRVKDKLAKHQKRHRTQRASTANPSYRTNSASTTESNFLVEYLL